MDKNIYFNGWHIIPDYKSTSQFLSHYNNNVQYTNQIYNYLYDLNEDEDFVIFSDANWWGTKASKRFTWTHWNKDHWVVRVEWWFPHYKFWETHHTGGFTRHKWNIKDIIKKRLEPKTDSRNKNTYIEFEANIVSNHPKVLEGVPENEDKPNFAQNIPGVKVQDYKDGKTVSKSTDGVFRIKIYYVIEGEYAGYYAFENMITNCFLVEWTGIYDTLGVDPAIWGDRQTDTKNIDNILKLHETKQIKKYSNRYMFRVSKYPDSKEEFNLLFNEPLLTE